MSPGVYIPGPTIFNHMAEKSAYQKAFDAGARAVKKLKEKTKRSVSRRSGLTGRAGAIIIGTTPLALPTMRAISVTGEVKGRYPNMPIVSQVTFGYLQWLNTFVSQFGMQQPFREISLTVNEKGGTHTFASRAEGPFHGSIWKIWAAGFAAIGADRAASWIAGHGTKIPGTGVLAIGTKG